MTSLAIHDLGKTNHEDPSEIGWADAQLEGPVDDGGVWLEDIVVRVVDVAGRPLILDIIWGRP